MRYRYLPYTDKSGGDSPGQLICLLWHGIASQFLAQNIYLPSQTVILVSNAYTVLCMSRTVDQSENVGILPKAVLTCAHKEPLGIYLTHKTFWLRSSAP